MTNPTSNYSFQMPTSTDLVTDLPADFEVFGQAVDTRLKALQPGTTLGDLAYSSATANTNTRLPIGTNGQVLGIAGGVPVWTTDASGMINPMTTTGDVIYSSGGSTPARRGIGTTGQVLTVAAGLPTWAAPATGSRTLIASGTLSGASVSVSSIPTTYQDLYLVFTSVNPTDDSTFLQVRINGQTTNYGSPTAALKLTAQTFGSASWTWDVPTDDTVVTNLYTATIPNYAGSTWKMFLGNAITVNPTTTTQYNFNQTMGFHNTTSAITSLAFQMNSGNFDGGSYFVYGVQ